MRVKYLVMVAFMGGLTLLLGPTTGLTQPGRGGPGGFDPGAIFDRMARGQPTMRIADMRFGRETVEAWAQKNGVTNGLLTRDQYVAYSQSPEAAQAREQMMQRFRGGQGGPGSSPSPGGGERERDRGDRDRGDRDRWMEESFRRRDQNGDGFLNYDEMTDTLKAEREKWDVNKDGQIDANEWRDYVRAFAEQRREEGSWSRGSSEREGDRGDGSPPPDKPKLDVDKKVVVYRAGKLPPNLPKWFGEYDGNLDAQVALFEWKDKNGTVEDFQKMDLNADGFVTAEELLKVTTLAKKDEAAPGAAPGAPGSNPYSRGGDNRGPGRGGPGMMAGRGGPGMGPGRGAWDPSQMFRMFASGKSTIVIAEIREPRSRERMTEWAKKNNVTNGQLTQEQFGKYLQEAMQSMGSRNRGPGGPPGGNGEQRDRRRR